MISRLTKFIARVLKIHLVRWAIRKDFSCYELSFFSLNNEPINELHEATSLGNILRFARYY